MVNVLDVSWRPICLAQTSALQNALFFGRTYFSITVLHESPIVIVTTSCRRHPQRDLLPAQPCLVTKPKSAKQPTVVSSAAQPSQSASQSAITVAIQPSPTCAGQRSEFILEHPRCSCCRGDRCFGRASDCLALYELTNAVQGLRILEQIVCKVLQRLQTHCNNTCFSNDFLGPTVFKDPKALNKCCSRIPNPRASVVEGFAAYSESLKKHNVRF